MGSAASKNSRRILQDIPKPSATPTIQPSRQPARQPALRPDGHDPQEFDGNDADLLERLRHISPIEVAPESQAYQPASKDNMSTTLAARQHFEIKDPASARRSTNKTLLPSQTITAIVAMLQRGEPHDQIIQAFQIDPSVLPKLANLSIPEAKGPQGGVGVRRR